VNKSALRVVSQIYLDHTPTICHHGLELS